MFGVALDLKLSDFTYISKNPKSVIVGLFSQWIILPILTLILIWIIRPEYSLALGMILISACPGGNVSNYAVHLAGANTALSVIITTTSTLFCVLSTPILFSCMSKWLPGVSTQPIEFDISFYNMAITIGQLILLPILFGQIMTIFFPEWVKKIRKPIKILSLLIFIAFVIVAIAGNLQNLQKYIGHVFFIVMLHNGLALTIGYVWANKLMKLDVPESRAISIETGIQNSGLALILIFNYYDGKGGMALIAAWWSVWHLLSASGLAYVWRKKRNAISVRAL